MYHIEASIGGHVRTFHYPMIKHNAIAILFVARNAFSHSRCDWVRICDSSGPVRYVSHTGEMYA
jgi:hypothetical protein